MKTPANSVASAWAHTVMKEPNFTSSLPCSLNQFSGFVLEGNSQPRWRESASPSIERGSPGDGAGPDTGVSRA